MHRTIAIVLAGGRGTRLTPLTAVTPKSVLQFAGSYRLIDFALSNCVHSGIPVGLVVTGHGAGAVEAYVDRFGRLLPSAPRRPFFVPRMEPSSCGREGTAAAVQSVLAEVRRLAPRDVLVLASDHVYRMNYAAMVEAHRTSRAGVTIGSMVVPREQARHFGVLVTDRSGRIESFAEKPTELSPAGPRFVRVSMGVYVFDPEVLESVLAADCMDPRSSHDFGTDVIPALVASRRARAYPFSGYWRDLGTLEAYYLAHRELLAPRHSICFADPSWPILSAASRSGRPHLSVNKHGALLGEGCVCDPGARVRESVIGSAVHVERGASLDSCVVMDGARIGAGARLRGVIVDQNEAVPAGFCLGEGWEGDRTRYVLSSGRLTPFGRESGSCAVTLDVRGAASVTPGSSRHSASSRRVGARLRRIGGDRRVRVRADQLWFRVC